MNTTGAKLNHLAKAMNASPRNRGFVCPPVRKLASALRTGLGVIALGAASHAFAATITVTGTVDETETDGNCSLREAVANANQDAQAYADCDAGTGSDTIVFDPAVFPAGTLTASLVTSTLILNGNSVTIDGGGTVAIDGGGTTGVFIVNPSTQATFRSLTINHGKAYMGAGIRNDGTTFLDRVTLSDNSATAQGGGIHNSGTLHVDDSTIANNVAANLGGGISNGELATLSVTNSTLSGNTTTEGGGIYSPGTIYQNTSLKNVTLSGNSAVFGANIYAKIAAGLALQDSIIANGLVGSNCRFGSGTNVADQGDNIDDGNSCLLAASSSGVDPLLGPLGDNGGPTQTMLPLTGSPALDAVCRADEPAKDQRGISRPQGAGCDIGAVEVAMNKIFADGFEVDGTPMCSMAADCPDTGSACVLKTCSSGVCGQTNATAGTACGDGMTCDGAGECI